MILSKRATIKWHPMEQQPDVDGEELFLVVVRTTDGKLVVATALYLRIGEIVWHIQHVWQKVLNGTIIRWAKMPNPPRELEK